MVLKLGCGLAVAVEWREAHQLPATCKEHLWSATLFTPIKQCFTAFVLNDSILTAKTFWRKSINHEDTNDLSQKSSS